MARWFEMRFKSDLYRYVFSPDTRSQSVFCVTAQIPDGWMECLDRQDEVKRPVAHSKICTPPLIIKCPKVDMLPAVTALCTLQTSHCTVKSPWLQHRPVQIGQYRAVMSGHNKSNLITCKWQCGRPLFKIRFKGQNGFVCSLNKAKMWKVWYFLKFKQRENKVQSLIWLTKGEWTWVLLDF